MPPKSPPPMPKPGDIIVAQPGGVSKIIPFDSLPKDERDERLADLEARYQEHLREQDERNQPSRDTLLTEALTQAETATADAGNVEELKAAMSALIDGLRGIFAQGGPV